METWYKKINVLGNQVNQRSQRQQGFVQYVLKMMGMKLQTNLMTNQNPKKPRIVLIADDVAEVADLQTPE